MKILHLVQKPQRRGAEIFAFQLAERQTRTGHSSKIVYLYPGGQEALPLRNGDQTVGISEKHFSEKFPGWNPSIIRKLRAIVSDFDPDVIQLNGARTIKYGAALRFFPTRKRVFVYRNIGDPRVWLRGFWRKFVYRKFLMAGVDGMVAVSEVTRSVLKALYSERQNTVVIPRGVDPDVFVPKQPRDFMRQEFQIPPSAVLLIYVGSLTSEKRVDRLLRIFSKVYPENPHLQLWIVGDGSLRNVLEQQSAQLGISNSVHFLGTQSDVASFVNAADLFLLTSDTEGIPGTILEAGLLGIPAIAFQVGGISECIRNGETGVLIHPKNDEEFEKTILRLAQDKQERFQMGSAAQQFIHSRFTIDRVSDAYNQFYKDLCDQAHRRS